MRRAQNRAGQGFDHASGLGLAEENNFSFPWSRAPSRTNCTSCSSSGGDQSSFDASPPAEAKSVFDDPVSLLGPVLIPKQQPLTTSSTLFIFAFSPSSFARFFFHSFLFPVPSLSFFQKPAFHIFLFVAGFAFYCIHSLILVMIRCK
ncbi:hypothetical protein ASPTUDRAFT_586834 [Aspergillus tubingensis CBS 134.48]|uniref:Uncharacterized protein n=1 Tax=Aspergillus tubingensis (strain CBS 134.48) TaxID=767770 RepID=A0A1L9N947_ASPTC|nr:hypothetical protein ASPTUDRAFT_586834 [Aspergillus tubingensis CBS 134.48]